MVNQVSAKEIFTKNVKGEYLLEVMNALRDYDAWMPQMKFVRTEQGRHHDCTFNVYTMKYKGDSYEVKTKVEFGMELLYYFSITKKGNPLNDSAPPAGARVKKRGVSLCSKYRKRFLKNKWQGCRFSHSKSPCAALGGRRGPSGRQFDVCLSGRVRKTSSRTGGQGPCAACVCMVAGGAYRMCTISRR